MSRGFRLIGVLGLFWSSGCDGYRDIMGIRSSRSIKIGVMRVILLIVII